MTRVDRITSTKRPEGKAAGTQRWRELLFVHWVVDEAALRALVPPCFELDLYEGRAYVGIVPFKMEGVKPWWAPEAAAFSFLETNLRTYVLYNGEPGVLFFSLEAASWIAVKTARAGWGLPYHHADMETSRSGDEVHYKTVRRSDEAARFEVRYRVGEPLGPSVPGSAEHFFLERYLLFVERGGVVERGQVYHTPYPAQRVEIISLDEGLFEAAGLPPAQGPAVLAHWASGVDVEVFSLSACQG